jgi:uncharacterized protein (TIGR02145 family)
MSPGIYYATVPSKTYIPIPVTIGDQVWDKQNLDTAYYRDGSPIQYAYTSNTSTVGAYFWYDGLQSNGIIYGKLYNWWAVNNTKNIAPFGWRVAAPADWDDLATYLGGASIAGNKLKQTGTTLWQSPNGGTNSSGFTALPGGLLNMATPAFENINQFAYFRTSDSADIKRLQYNSAALQTATANNFSFHSVRLIKITVQLTTNNPTAGSPTFSSLNTGGNISNLNDYVLSSWGVCYNTSPNPTISNNTAAGTGTGTIGIFTSTITGLNANTSYYIRAYVSTTNGDTFYGQEVIGTTTGTSTITTTAITNVMSTSATSGGTITSSAGNTITQSGICWSTSPLPTIANAKTTDGQTGVAPPNKTCGTGLMTALLQSTTYYVRAYVSTGGNPENTTYGNQETFQTNPGDVLKASYSLRQTVSSYSGAAVRVRGIIVGSTIIADVSFNASGWVDTDSPITIISGTYGGGLTLGAFAILASTVWVQTWYDQSGNAKNVNQTITITRQPTIAVSGALNRAGVNSKVALKFTRANTSWLVSATDTSLAMNNTQVYTVCNSDTHTATAYGQVAVALNATNRYFSGAFGVGTGSPSTGAEWIGYGSASSTYASALLLTPAIPASQLFYSISNATGISSWLNDTSKGTYSTTNGATSQNINIGSTGTASIVHFNGSIQEVQIYTPSGTPNRQEVSDNIRGYYGIPT